jgi:hypothetical protein
MVGGTLEMVVGHPCAMVRDSETMGGDSPGPMSGNHHMAEQFPVGDTSLSPGLVRSTYPGWVTPKMTSIL